jgi:carbamoyltransferase
MAVSTNILGISAYYHDSAASLLRDGEIVAAAQEERFTRRKGDAGYPHGAVAYALREAGITAGDLDHVIFYEKPLVKFERLYETYLAFGPSAWHSFREALPRWAQHRLHLPRLLREQLGDDFRGELHFGDHHESHAASAFFPSPFAEAAILTMDAVGEWASSSIGHGRDNRIELLEEMRFPHSVGMLYSAFTAYTGFKVNSGEYKLMGLAPYGEPKYVSTILDEIVDIHEDGSITLDLSYFAFCQGATMTSERFHDLFGGPPRPAESFITARERDLAASIQAVTEEIVLRAARHAHELTGSRNLVMAGGVALNCVANGRLSREGPFEELWIQPAAGDAGGSLGAALLAWHHLLDRPRHLQEPDGQGGSFLGPAYRDEDIRQYLDSVGAVYRSVPHEDELLDAVARSLDDGRIVGWFHGRMEFGPRALGARSILGDARNRDMQQSMNLKIKFRESFRPFAPCVLREHVSETFEMRPDEDDPYMLVVAPVRERLRVPLTDEQREQLRDDDLRVRAAVVRSTLPAITHVDYSARVQTVDADRHGRYYRLMRRFHELTGCPVIVNTSFNIRGEPIVCTPEDAYRCFLATDMDVLVLEDQLLMKHEQPSGRVDADSYRAQYALD